MSGAEVGTARSPGTLTVNGRYRLITLVGSGGMGRVWRAHDETLDRQVAVKELMPPAGTGAGDRRAQALSSMAEARAAARIEHPGVVRVYDVLRTTGRSWIVMEFVPSHSLQERLNRDGPLPHREAARVGAQVLRALRAAHAAGVLHHDVKPHNVLLATDGRIMLTDFGIATFGGGRLDSGSPLIGSPYYIAPERLRDRITDTGTDLWSLGAMLYTMVEGRPPFRRPTTQDSLRAVLEEEPDPAVRPGPVHEVVSGLLAKDPAARLDAGEAESALTRIAGEPAAPVPAPRRPAGTDFRRGTAAVTPAPPPVAVPARTRRRKPLVWAGVVVAGAAAVAAVAVLAPDRDTGAAAPTASVTLPTVDISCGDAPRTPAATRHRDTSGFQVTLPQGWTRAATADVVCLTDPGRSRSFEVRPGSTAGGQPLARLQEAEKDALASGDLPGYRRISMGVLLVTGGGADWEYTWQPARGPRLHVHRYVWPSYDVSWTTPDDDWTAAQPMERAIRESFTDPERPTQTWAVPSPS